MSVYTTLTENNFSEILKLYALGELIQFEGIPAGIENTNYYVTTSKGEYVFTIFEKININDVNYYISLLEKLSFSGIVCPQPQTDLNNTIIHKTNGKPYAFFSRLSGQNLTSVNKIHCEAIARELAKFHTTPFSFTNAMRNRHGKVWRETTANKLLHQLSAVDAQLLNRELSLYRELDKLAFPKGIIHGDLFRDNALFVGDRLSGIIDFYDACYDSYLFDVAITVNDWCRDASGNFDQILYETFLNEYQKIRPFTSLEKHNWNLMLRFAATRFWLSRLNYRFYPRKGEVTHTKEPDVMKNLLKFHILNTTPYIEHSK